MTKNQVIERLFLSKNFLDCIGKMEPTHLQDDLKSEVILILCEMNEEKLMGLHERKELEFYAVRVILNLIKSDTSPFSKKFRQPTAELSYMSDHPVDEIVDIVEREKREIVEDKLLQLINTTDRQDDKWYHKELLKLYMEVGDYRSVADQTTIPFPSCYKSIIEYRKHLIDIFSQPIYTQRELIKILKVTQKTIWNWTQKGFIKAENGVKVGRTYIFSKNEVDRVKELLYSKPLDEKKVCSNCKEKKTLDNFYEDKLNRTLDGYKAQCKICLKLKRMLSRQKI